MFGLVSKFDHGVELASLKLQHILNQVYTFWWALTKIIIQGVHKRTPGLKVFKIIKLFCTHPALIKHVLLTCTISHRCSSI